MDSYHRTIRDLHAALGAPGPYWVLRRKDDPRMHLVGVTGRNTPHSPVRACWTLPTRPKEGRRRFEWKSDAVCYAVNVWGDDWRDYVTVVKVVKRCTQ